MLSECLKFDSVYIHSEYFFLNSLYISKHVQPSLSDISRIGYFNYRVMLREKKTKKGEKALQMGVLAIVFFLDVRPSLHADISRIGYFNMLREKQTKKVRKRAGRARVWPDLM